MRNSCKPKVLCLGLSFADIEGQLSKLQIGKRDRKFRDCRNGSVDAVVRSVRRCLLSEMDGRDLARCISTERICGVDVYTVSQEKGAVYRDDRHLDANFNRHDFVKNLRKRFGEDCCFDEIILDYFWIPQGWDASHWSKSFFEKTLVSFAAENMLREGTGAIYLPFCLHCFKSVRMTFHKLKQYFNVSFIRKNELSKISLWKGTQGIDPFNMQHFLGKKLNQEDIYCTFGPRDVAEAMEDSGISKSVLIKLARSLEDFHSIRFICLTLLPGKRPALTKKTFGSFTGCIAPSKVERGFYQMELDSLSNIKAETNIISCTPARRTTYETKPETAKVRRCLFPAEESGHSAFVSESSNSEISTESTVAISLQSALGSRVNNASNFINVSDNVLARKRGRPPKSDVTSSKISSIGSPSSNLITNSEKPWPRKRGRPPKSDMTSCKSTSIGSPLSNLITNSEKPRPRKRGRPPKSDMTSCKSTSIGSPSSNLITNSEKPRPRKRGRPPKSDMTSCKSTSIGSPSSNLITNSEKPRPRKRGRPPKSDMTSCKSTSIGSPSSNLITNSEKPRPRKRGRPPKSDTTSCKSSSIGSPSVRDKIVTMIKHNHSYNTRRKTSCFKFVPAIVTPVGIATPDIQCSPISNGYERSRSQSPTQVRLSPKALFPSCLVSNTFDAMPRHYFDIKSQGEAGNSPTRDVARSLSPGRENDSVPIEIQEADIWRVYSV